MRNLITGELTRHSADAVVLATGGYGNVFFLSTKAKGCNTTAIWRAHRKGAYFANPCYTQIHPTCIPVSGDYQSKLTLMSESLRNDGRVWVPKQSETTTQPGDIPEAERDYYLERRYPCFGTSCRATSPRERPKSAGRRIRRRRTRRTVSISISVTLFTGSDGRWSNSATATSSICTRTLPARARTKSPMRIYPAVHYTMGGLWVDYNLMSNVPGLFVIGEANFSDHGANRLGASALMQGLADGYFVLPATIGGWLA